MKGAQLHVPVDDCQQIVEVMRYSACQGSQAFHLLRLPKLVLEALSGRYVLF